MTRFLCRCMKGVLRRGYCSVATLAAFAVVSAAAFAVAGETGQFDIPDAAISALIDQLDDDEFAVRRDATRKLGQSGLSAVAPLAKAAAGDSLETAFRALDALAKLSFSPDALVEDAAFTAMAELAGSTHRTANRAKASLVGLRQHYQTRAKDRLQELGASFEGARRIDDEVLVPRVGGGAIFIRGGMVVDRGDIYFANSVALGDSWKGKPRDLRLLARLAGLDQVLLTGPKVTDEWLEELGHLSTASVRHIELRKTQVTDRGIAHLAKLKSLTNIDIMHSPITDAAIDTIGSLPELRYVRMYGTKVTPAGGQALEAKLPNARIDRRGGALLGVGGAINEQPCIINTVQENSAAAKGGIRLGDVIVQFDGKSVQNFTELTTAIAEKAGGDKVEVVLVRPTASSEESPPQPAKPLRVTIALGEW